MSKSVNFFNTGVNIADTVGRLHQKGDCNEAHEVVPVSWDHDNSDGTATKQFLIT